MKELKKFKGWIIALGVILGVVLLVVILNFTLFSISTIEIDFKNQTQIFTEESKSNIIANSGINKGTSVFGLSKKSAKAKLERDNPYLKVVNIETVFPNKIIIHCAEREETYAVKASDKKYFICDADFKVLNIQPSYRNDQYNAILFNGLESIIQNTNRVNAGEFLEFSSEEKILKSIGSSLLQANKNVSEQRALIQEINFTSAIYLYTATNLPYLEIKDYNNFITNIYVLDDLLAQKFNYMFLSLSQVIYNPRVFFEKELSEGKNYDEIPQDYYLGYTLQIRQNLSRQILLTLEKN